MSVSDLFLRRNTSVFWIFKFYTHNIVFILSPHFRVGDGAMERHPLQFTATLGPSLPPDWPGNLQFHDAATPRTSYAGADPPSAVVRTSNGVHQPCSLQDARWKTCTPMTACPSVPLGVPSRVCGKRSVYSDARLQRSGPSPGGYAPDRPFTSGPGDWTSSPNSCGTLVMAT